MSGHRRTLISGSIELADGRALPLNAHHEHLHTGTAGEMLFTKAGHVVVPLAPLTPFEGCQDNHDFVYGS